MDRKTEYRQKLLDPRWQKRRLEVLTRDDWTCQQCGAKDKTLHVHHARYQSGDPWETSANLLVTMCADCHELEPDEYRTQLDDLLETLLGAMGMRSSVDFMYLTESAAQYLWADTDGRNAREHPYTPEEIAKALGDAIARFPRFKAETRQAGDWWLR